MTTDGAHRLPPPPLFTIRPPPTPPGSLFEHFQAVQILNGRCVRPSLTSPANVVSRHDDSFSWMNVVLLVLAVISVVCCVVIAVFIFICLKKLRKEEKQYQSYIMSGSLSSKVSCHRRHVDSCTRTSEHYKCTGNPISCCDDYYSHQLMPLASLSSRQPVKSTATTSSSSTDKPADGQETPPNHQYECIPEYLLTMARRHHSPIVCHHPHNGPLPYNTFSRSYLLPQAVPKTNTTDENQCTCTPQPPSAAQEESSVPLLAPTTNAKESDGSSAAETSSRVPLIIGWTRRNQPSTTTTTTKKKTTEHRRSFLSQLRKSSIL